MDLVRPLIWNFNPLLPVFLDGLDKGGNVAVACCLGGVQLLFDMIVHIVFGVLQREVFQFGFQLVQSSLWASGAYR